MHLAFGMKRTFPWLFLAAVAIAVGTCGLRQAGFFGRIVTVDVPDGSGGTELKDLKIVTLLPKAGIPAVFNPSFVDAGAAQGQLLDDDLVIGVSISGEARAYGVAYLSSHEIVNDNIGGTAIAVTW